MEIGQLIAAFFMILIGLFCIIFNKKMYEWNIKWRGLFYKKKKSNEKSISTWIRFFSIIAGIGFMALGIYVLIAYS